MKIHQIDTVVVGSGCAAFRMLQIGYGIWAKGI